MASKAFKKFLPLFDRVLIQRFEAQSTSKGGIMLPETSKGKVLEGEVLAVGDGMRTNDGKVMPLTVKIGDKVFLPEYGGTKLLLDEKEYYLFREADLLGKFD
uniref:10 kDa heat shock protein, mitochondrial n=1 Tax=Dugesia japonica TaxID=6161 RepID=A0A2U8U4E3_DUGJA|nr:HSP10 [Dugesia japonica]